MRSRVTIALFYLVLLSASMVSHTAPIHNAAAKGDLAKVKALLKRSPALVNLQDENGATPLHYAAADGQVLVAQVLIAHKASINARKRDGVTPLHIAASLGRTHLARLLIDDAADVNALDKMGRTPLSLAITSGQSDLIGLLLSADDFVDRRGMSATNPSDGITDDPYAASIAGVLQIALGDEPFTIFRQTSNGYERQVPLRFLNNGEDIPAGDVYVTSNRWALQCPLESIPKGESHDVVWVAKDVATVDLHLIRNGKLLYETRISLPKAAEEKSVVIPQSLVTKKIPPLAIRGTNYLPRDHPWPGLFREATVQDYETDFALMGTLGINTMRTFVFYDPDLPNASLGLYRKDGSSTTLAQKRLADLLRVADSHGIKVILCPGALPPLEDIRAARRMFKTIFGPFANDGRILMFDVMNEPGGNDGPKANTALSAWLTTMYPYTKRLLPNHLVTVGLCWQFDQLWDLGIKPDVAQYHDYSGAIGRQPVGSPSVRNVSDDLRRTISFVGSRPLFIGEFGHSTAGPSVGGVDEQRQREIYEGVLIGAEDQCIAGVANWTLFDFAPDWMGKKEQVFGILRKDGSLKPSGELLKSTYQRWSREHPAPWDIR